MNINIKETFLRLTSKTYPNPSEDGVLDFFPDNIELEKDDIGNYFIEIKPDNGNTRVVFTSHLDTASRKEEKVRHVLYKENDEEFVKTDGTNILGADDKAGVVIMLNMIENNIPGLYYFFIGEERGMLGSAPIAQNIEQYPQFVGKEIMVSFDRMGTKSIITSQMGSMCCSDEFTEALIREFGNQDMVMRKDPTGSYTDSAAFMRQIPECTNISVGYYSQHSNRERQNITFLEKISEAVLSIDWESLPAKRDMNKVSSYGYY